MNIWLARLFGSISCCSGCDLIDNPPVWRDELSDQIQLFSLNLKTFEPVRKINDAKSHIPMFRRAESDRCPTYSDENIIKSEMPAILAAGVIKFSFSHSNMSASRCRTKSS